MPDNPKHHGYYEMSQVTYNSDCSMPAIIIFNYGDSDIPLYLLVTFKPATQLIFKPGAHQPQAGTCLVS